MSDYFLYTGSDDRGNEPPPGPIVSILVVVIVLLIALYL